MSLPISTKQRIAEELLGSVVWKECQERGYCRCPGIEHHNNQSRKKDCTVTVDDGAPTIYCLHTSCADEVAAANKSLRSAMGKATARAKMANSPGAQKRGKSPVNRTSRTVRFQVIPETEGQKRTIRTVDFYPSRIVRARKHTQKDDSSSSGPSVSPAVENWHWEEGLPPEGECRQGDSCGWQPPPYFRKERKRIWEQGRGWVDTERFVEDMKGNYVRLAGTYRLSWRALERRMNQSRKRKNG